MAKKLLPAGLVGVGAAAAALLLWFGGALDRWELTTWNWRVRLMARPSEATDRIKIILLDQASLDWGSQENGLSWPWPREVYGPVIDFCRRGGARAVAFDVIFSEPSVYGVEDDQALGAAIGRGRNFIAAVFLGEDLGGVSAWPAEIPPLRWPLTMTEAWPRLSPESPLAVARAMFPVPEIISSAAALGNVSERPDSDGIIRRASLARIFSGQAVPSLGVAAYLVAAEAEAAAAVWGLAGDVLRVGENSVKLDEAGRAILGFVGPVGTHQIFSAAAIVQSELRLLAGEDPVVDPRQLSGCTVFFGYSAPGLLDLRPTPLDRVCPGVVIHATLLDNLRADGFLRDAPQWLVLALIVALALTSAVLIVLARRIWQSIAAFILLLPVPVLIGVAAYGAKLWWPVVAGEVAVAVALVGGVVLNYATEGRQKQFIKQAFKFYLSPDVIDRILADPSQLSLGGERRELTLLFADLEGFTAISESLDPAPLTVLLNDYLSDMTEIVLAEGGTLDKYEGDAFIAFWNAPLAQADHAARACRAALRCQRRLADRRAEFERRSGQVLRMRIGVHTGEVVVGNMGSRQRFNYTVLGDAANLASRLEGANKAFGTFTMISEATWQQAQPQLQVRELGRLQVVGRRAPVRVFELRGMAGESPSEMVPRFEQGLASYYDGDVSAALAVFETLADDPAARAYVARCRQLVRESSAGPPDSTGIWVLTEK